MQSLKAYINDITQSHDLTADELVDAANEFNAMQQFLRSVKVSWTVEMNAPEAGEIPAFLDEAIDNINSAIQEQADYLEKMEKYFLSIEDETRQDQEDEAGYVREVSSPYLSGRI